ncbi:precorrin-6y C5,15-methyltransferase (decarboxylating) subunit CbiE [Alkalimarinus coralli]|uniref:precorrin-6y C5,15-methyltransferase (decarboxylating) subunit CbiE n=1 Tax=Alkalimarinus coralli TaxID=2935863 RepID=UPI00202B8CA6|nr:precorrin-6y C5,15-methyltransferase (decarboxylating) subunit CbiE [Alkalimarinus coralli]
MKSTIPSQAPLASNMSSTSQPKWIGCPINIIGLGVGAGTGPALGESAQAALHNADWVVGAEHQLEKVSGYQTKGEKIPYPSPFSGLAEWLFKHQQQRIVLLASGDPLYYGLGDWLGRTVGREQLVFHANISSIQAAFHQLGLPWQSSETITLHGRPLASLRARVQPGKLYAVLTDQHSHPAAIAHELIDCQFEQSLLWVCEDLGGKAQQIRSFHVDDPKLTSETFHPLHVTIIQCQGSGGLLPTFPGIEDALFETGKAPGKGLITKKEVRLAILSQLAPKAGDIGWDIGAGCGSVAIEWARWNPNGTVFAVENNAERLSYCSANQTTFGVVNNLHIIDGTAPDACDSLPDPDAVFIGGSGGQLEQILNTALSRLKPAGKVVASAVTETTKATLIQFAEQTPASVSVEWSQIALSRGDSIAGQLVMRPQLPVTLLTLTKGVES